MPNPYHFRAKVDRLWQCANSNARGYKKLKALNTLVREMYGPSERAQRNHQMYLATDPYDVARHHLRDLYDRADPTRFTSEISLRPPLPLGEGWGEGPPTPEEESPEEDDDPL